MFRFASKLAVVALASFVALGCNTGSGSSAASRGTPTQSAPTTPTSTGQTTPTGSTGTATTPTNTATPTLPFTIGMPTANWSIGPSGLSEVPAKGVFVAAVTFSASVPNVEVKSFKLGTTDVVNNVQVYSQTVRRWVAASHGFTMEHTIADSSAAHIPIMNLVSGTTEQLIMWYDLTNNSGVLLGNQITEVTWQVPGQAEVTTDITALGISIDFLVEAVPLVDVFAYSQLNMGSIWRGSPYTVTMAMYDFRSNATNTANTFQVDALVTGPSSATITPYLVDENGWIVGVPQIQTWRSTQGQTYYSFSLLPTAFQVTAANDRTLRVVSTFPTSMLPGRYTTAITGSYFLDDVTGQSGSGSIPNNNGMPVAFTLDVN